MRPWPGTVHIDRAGSVSLRLGGDVDAATASEVDRQVDLCLRSTSRLWPPLIVDCSQVTFMDTRGLATLLRHGRRVRLVEPSRPVQRLLENL